MYTSWDIGLFRMHFRFIVAIFYFQHTQASDNIFISLSVLPDPENMGIAVGISLLSGIQANI